MSTRLDRLLLLLDSGSTPATRRAAALQIGDLAKYYPQDLGSLLGRVQTYLRSKNWDTRTAASQAIQAIADNVPLWDPPADTVPKTEPGAGDTDDGDYLSFNSFSIAQVLAHGRELLGSAGSEYDVDYEGMDQQERLALQRETLKSRLGLRFGNEMDFDIQAEDVEVSKPPPRPKIEPSPQSSPGPDLTDQLAGLSARERNRAKRMARAKPKTRPGKKEHTQAAAVELERPMTPVGGSGGGVAVGGNVGGNVGASLGVNNPLKRIKSTPGTPASSVQDDLSVVEDNGEPSGRWPFEALCEDLRHELFSPVWEVRHGAGAALREILRSHGPGAGKVAGVSLEGNSELNGRWLEDCAIRLLCIFALDRFGDFVADQVVAPVRETCAQALGALLQHLPPSLVSKVLHELLLLQTRPTWEVRHGGLLGVKYIVAVRQDMAPQLLPQVLPAVLGGLRDQDDDVRAVSAEALLPMAAHIVSLAKHVVPELLSVLWGTLIELDDLTASTSSVMALLAELLSYKEVAEANEAYTGQSLTHLVPRLWAFFRHNNSAVRMAALRPLDKLLTATEADPSWLYPILGDGMRHVFQNILLDDKDKVLELNDHVWNHILRVVPPQILAQASAPFLANWTSLLVTAPGMPYNPTDLLRAQHTRAAQAQGANAQAQAKRRRVAVGPMHGPTMPANPDHVMKLRLDGANALARLAAHWPANQHPTVHSVIVGLLQRVACASRLVGAALLADWATVHRERTGTVLVVGNTLLQTLHTLLSDPYLPNFEELEPIRQRLRSDALALLHSFMDRRLQPAMLYQDAGDPTTFNEDMAMRMATECYAKWAALCGDKEGTQPLEGSPRAVCEGKRQRLLGTVGHLQAEQQRTLTAVGCALVHACVCLCALPAKLNPVVRPTMDGLKTEENTLLQARCATALAGLLDQLQGRTPNPSEKIIKNICTMSCADTQTTPLIAQTEVAPNAGGEDEEGLEVDKHSGILSLEWQVRAANMAAGPGGPGRRPKKVADPDATLTDEQKAGRIQRRGGEFALQRLASHFGERLLTVLPFFWDNIKNPVVAVLADSPLDTAALSQDEDGAQQLVYALQPLRVVVPSLHPSLHHLALDLLPCLFAGLSHPYKAVRFMCASAIASTAQTALVPTMHAVVKDLLPRIGDPTSTATRQGVMETVHNIMDTLKLDVVPYLVFLVVPVLGRMTDQNQEVRRLAAFCFAAIIKLMPLEAGMANPEGMDSDLIARKLREREFLEQLADSSKLKPAVVPASIKASLREYQQEGVNWMDFLRRYNLHGVLGDDMGLGKTLQAISIMAIDHEAQEAEGRNPVLPHLVVSPPTLTGHWFYEIQRFSSRMRPLQYMGSPGERAALRERIKKHDVILVSYDILRNEIDFFKNLQFSYCILDEGHMIKSSKAKVTKAVKAVQADHRLILSGTPIQNNVLELWSLFDFLMPGFLGTARQFNETYSRPILASRDAKASSKDHEAGVLAMEALHRQVLPFMLRRVKDDVLKDLPPKIIQDYYCDLSPLQRRLYEDFSSSKVRQDLEVEAYELAEMEERQGEKRKRQGEGGPGHIFQALQYLRKVCTHPALVLTPDHPEYASIMAQGTDTHSIDHAPKLLALKQLLQDCGIGVGGGEGGLDDENVTQHRVLLFCQLKSMLDIVEKDLLAKHMPSVTYLRMDGGTDASQRYDVVQKFNTDPTIDILLLTTHVGGLGLNLTGADTVIFLEHDWNPMKDMQAMDRAHRIGQKKVVNVYRLITKDTLEEKVMGLQKFKLNIANTVVTMDNSSLKSMDTSQLLDLFSLEDKGKEKKEGEKKGAKGVLEGVEELWGEEQYEDEYNMNAFVASLKK